jgi:hypothetical protein
VTPRSQVADDRLGIGIERPEFRARQSAVAVLIAVVSLIERRSSVALEPRQ